MSDQSAVTGGRKYYEKSNLHWWKLVAVQMSDRVFPVVKADQESRNRCMQRSVLENDACLWQVN